MEFRRLAIAEVIEIRPTRLGDERGWFSETFKRDALADLGVDVEFTQDNESFSAEIATLRGLHYQLPPHPQAKIVRVVRGSIHDVAVDIRRDSPTFGRHVAVTLSAEVGNQLLVPEGFAHGFCTLEPDVQVAYKVTGRYAPSRERAIRWNDEALGIDWPIPHGVEPVLSAKDSAAPLLAEQPDLF